MGIQSAVSDSADLAVTRARILRRNRTAGIVPPRRGDGEQAARTEISSGVAEQDTDASTPPSQLRRINEGGDAVPGSQDADLAARAERLSIATSQQTPIAAAPPLEQPSNGRRRRREDVPQQRWEGLQCCMCVGADAFHGHDSRGLMMHLVRAHLGQVVTAEAVAQLRTLDKAACQICAAIRARTTPYCRTCQCATPTRPLVLGDLVQDTRRPGQVPSAPQMLAGIKQKRIWTWALKNRMRQMQEERCEQSEYRMRRSELLSACNGVV
jgi:hypothetical protein